MLRTLSSLIMTYGHQLNKYRGELTQWHEDMNFSFNWQNNILRTSSASKMLILARENKIHNYLQAAM